jgi:hypothetical protein
MLDVAEDAPLGMIWVSRTAVSTGRPEPLGDDGGDLVLGEVACPMAGALDQSPQLGVREVAQRGVDLAWRIVPGGSPAPGSTAPGRRRKADLRALEAGLEQADAGKRQVIGVVAEPGTWFGCPIVCVVTPG